MLRNSALPVAGIFCGLAITHRLGRFGVLFRAVQFVPSARRSLTAIDRRREARRA
jgi:hypothetical protein